MTMTDLQNNEYPPPRPPWIIQGLRQSAVEAVLIAIMEKCAGVEPEIDRLRVLLTGGEK